MPLDKQPISISFSGGVDTKTDPYHLRPGKFSLLENTVFDTKGQLRKRPGHEALPRDISGGGSIGSGLGIYTLDDRMLLYDGTRAYAWTPSRGAWVAIQDGVSRGNPEVEPAPAGALLNAPGPVALVGGGAGVDAPPPMRPLSMTKRSAGVVSTKMAHVDMAIHEGRIAVVAWEDADSATGLLHSVIDFETGVHLTSAQHVTLAPSPQDHAPKVVVLGQYVVIFFLRDNALYYATIDSTRPWVGANTMAVPIQADAGEHVGAYDVCVLGRYAVIACNAPSGTIRIHTLSDTLALSADRVIFAGTADNGITVFPDVVVSNRVVVAWASTTEVWCAVVEANYSALAAVPYLLETVSDVTGVAGIAFTGTQEPIRIFWTVSPSGREPAQDFKVRTVRLRATYAKANAPFDFARSVGLCGKPFMLADEMYVPVVHDSEIQGTYFLCDSRGRVIAKMLSGAAAGQPNGISNPYGTTTLPESITVGDDIILPLQERRLGSAGIVNQVRLSSGARPPAAASARTLLLGGGLLWLWDGAQIVEHGFHLGPERVVAPNPGGTYEYQYLAVYEWMDDTGALHVSAPSPPITHAQGNAIDAQHSVAVQLPTCRLTSRVPGEVFIVPYRTDAGGTRFYRAVPPGTRPPVNDVTVDYVSFADTAEDGDLVGYAPIYTDGGAVQNDAPSCPAHLALFQTRVLLLDALNPYVIWISRETLPGSPVEFSANLLFNLQQSTGPARAIVGLEDKAIVFRDKSISVLYGKGPTNLGTDIGFEEVNLPSNEVGCSEPASIVSTGIGVLFKSAKGFYLIDRSGSAPQYIGADVEAYNGIPVTSAKALQDRNGVLFSMANGVQLWFDYQEAQWSVWPAIASVDSAIYQGRLVVLRSDGAVWETDPSGFGDDGAHVPLKARTPWIQLAGMQGLKRVYELMIFGRSVSNHSLRVEIEFNYQEGPAQVAVFDSLGAYAPLQWRVQFAQEECQSFRVTMTEQPLPGSQPGEGLRLSGMSILAGVKRGLFRMPASKTQG
jgi:hypothetical protein